MHYKQDSVKLIKMYIFYSWHSYHEKKIIQIQHKFWQSIFYFPLSFLRLSAWKIKEDQLNCNDQWLT